MKKFARSWKSSKKPKKQGKYRANAPLLIKQKLVHIHLSKDLRQKYNTRSLAPKKGDKVKIMRGEHKGKNAKVSKVDLKKSKIFVEGIEAVKKDGNKSLIPIDPSNIMLIEYNLDDKKRKKIIERKGKITKQKEQKVKK